MLSFGKLGIASLNTCVWNHSTSIFAAYAASCRYRVQRDAGFRFQKKACLQI